MITDANLLLAGQHKANGSIEPQTVTAAAVSSNTVDLRRPLDIGQGQPLFGRFQVHTAAAGGTSMELEKHALKTVISYLNPNELLINKSLAFGIYPYVNAAEAQLYLSKQMWEEANHFMTFEYIIETFPFDREDI